MYHSKKSNLNLVSCIILAILSLIVLVASFQLVQKRTTTQQHAASKFLKPVFDNFQNEFVFVTPTPPVICLDCDLDSDGSSFCSADSTAIVDILSLCPGPISQNISHPECRRYDLNNDGLVNQSDFSLCQSKCSSFCQNSISLKSTNTIDIVGNVYKTQLCGDYTGIESAAYPVGTTTIYSYSKSNCLGPSSTCATVTPDPNGSFQASCPNARCIKIVYSLPQNIRYCRSPSVGIEWLSTVLDAKNSPLITFSGQGVGTKSNPEANPKIIFNLGLVPPQ